MSQTVTPPVGSWGRWGPDDQRGAANLVTPQRTLDGLAAARVGRIIPLGSEVGRKGAISSGRNATWHSTIKVQHPDDPGRGRAEDTLNLHTHAHSHMDGLAHIWYGGKLYNGHDPASVGRGGANRLGIDLIGGLVTSGVLLDVTAGGSRVWKAGELVTGRDLADALTRSGTTCKPGVALMLRTGWFDRFLAGDPTFDDGEPGLDESAIDWVVAQDPCLIGVDNSAMEPIPPPPGTNPLAVHEALLRDHGIFMLELLDLSELAASGAGQFCFMVAPLRIERGLGSPVNPLAII